jgi:hypothetical protein
MNISSVGQAASIQADTQPAVSTPVVPQAPASTPPAYTVSLSSTAQKTAGGDVDHDGDSH